MARDTLWRTLLKDTASYQSDYMTFGSTVGSKVRESIPRELA
jgi:hypothetical protein